MLCSTLPRPPAGLAPWLAQNWQGIFGRVEQVTRAAAGIVGSFRTARFGLEVVGQEL